MQRKKGETEDQRERERVKGERERTTEIDRQIDR